MKLYLGLRPKDPSVIHFPLIKIVPRPFSFNEPYTHLIFTSQSAVEIFFAHCPHITQKILAVGQETKRSIEALGHEVAATAEEECAEGIVKLLEQIDLTNAFIFWPHSSLSRSLITDYLKEKKVPFRSCILYDTLPHLPGPLPPLEEIDEIIFTSPSTVHAFLHYFKQLPKDKKLTAIGPITQAALSLVIDANKYI